MRRTKTRAKELPGEALKQSLSPFPRGIGNVCDRDKIGGCESGLGVGRVSKLEIPATPALHTKRKCRIVPWIHDNSSRLSLVLLCTFFAKLRTSVEAANIFSVLHAHNIRENDCHKCLPRNGTRMRSLA